jgi:hypothetical protein
MESELKLDRLHVVVTVVHRHSTWHKVLQPFKWGSGQSTMDMQA